MIGNLSCDLSERRRKWSSAHLISARRDGDAAAGLIVPQPAPARALDADGRGGELRLHVVHRPELGHDELRQLAVRLSAAALARRGEVLPKDAVVQVPAAVELRGW